MAGEVVHVQELLDGHQVSGDDGIEIRVRGVLIAVMKIKQSRIQHLAYHQITQVKDYKIDILPCHPSQLLFLLMEGLSVHISMPIHFVLVYYPISNSSSACYPPLPLESSSDSPILSVSSRGGCTSHRAPVNVGKHYIHKLSFIQALQGFSLK